MTRYADGKRERRLSDEEYAMLAAGLARAEAEGANPSGIACARLLLLTGWRRGEATGLRWSELNLPGRTARLADTKTGVSAHPLARAVVELLERQPRTSSPFVFPARIGGKSLQGLPRMWDRMRSLPGLPQEVTLHPLRHSFASLAADLGYGDAASPASSGTPAAASRPATPTARTRSCSRWPTRWRPPRTQPQRAPPLPGPPRHIAAAPG